MVASSVASPLCTWLVAACMSAACEKDHRGKSPSIFQSPRWLRRKRTLAWSGNLGGGFVSSLYGSGIHGLMSSCFAFEPCQEYYNSRGLPFFGDNALSLFGFKLAPVNRRQRRMNKAAHSGKTMAVAVQPEKEALSKKKPITEKRRVVVTGIGVVSPVGHNVDEFYNNLLDGVSGISEIESFDCSDFPTRIAGEIKNFSADGWVSPKLSKRADKFMLYMLTAGKKALADGGITEDVIKELDKAKCGVLIGSALGGMKVFNDAIEALRVSYKKMNPFCVPFATTNMGSAMLAMDLGWMGPNYSISTACATSNFCILNAANHIIRGETDMMLCGGSDSAIIPIGLGGFVACRALSTRNSDPTRASRPWDMNPKLNSLACFDRTNGEALLEFSKLHQYCVGHLVKVCVDFVMEQERDGFVMGEGSGVLLLEELEHAKKRGAKIYAEFLGGSFTCDAYHMTEPHPDGAGTVLCIEKALKQSGVKREDVNYINAHATSTPAGDLKEYQAIIRCFGQNSELKINSTKSMIGHLLGAAGAVEAIAAIMAIQTGWVHPNTNLEKPDEGLVAYGWRPRGFTTPGHNVEPCSSEGESSGEMLADGISKKFASLSPLDNPYRHRGEFTPSGRNDEPCSSEREGSAETLANGKNSEHLPEAGIGTLEDSTSLADNDGAKLHLKMIDKDEVQKVSKEGLPYGPRLLQFFVSVHLITGTPTYAQPEEWVQTIKIRRPENELVNVCFFHAAFFESLYEAFGKPNAMVPLPMFPAIYARLFYQLRLSGFSATSGLEWICKCHPSLNSISNALDVFKFSFLLPVGDHCAIKGLRFMISKTAGMAPEAIEVSGARPASCPTENEA
nr:3-oxoacyl-[acyl-carrier-protein] synthase II, chloroplastic-like [Ipomoea batatas]